MFQSPTSAICAVGIVGQPPARRVTKRGKPFQLVDVVRGADEPAVGHVQAPYPHAVARRAERPCLRRGFHVGLVAPRGLAVETHLDVVEADPRRDRHAVPLVEPAVHDVIAERDERHGGELVVGALGLLHGQHVDVGALQPVGDAVDPGADRVDVPRGEPHGLQATGVDVARAVVNGKAHRLVQPCGRGVVGEHLHVGARRTPLGRPRPATPRTVRAQGRAAAPPRRRAPPTAPPSACRRATP